MVVEATAPGRMDPPDLEAGDESLTVKWTAPNDGGASITKYEIRYIIVEDFPTLNWIVVTSDASDTEKIIRGMADNPLENGTDYYVQVRACNSVGCTELWSPSATGTPLAPKLAKPENLDVSPLSLRKAELTWTGDRDADEYVVETRASGTGWASAARRTYSTKRVEMDLDRLMPGQGLANSPYAYDIRVKATDSRGVYPESAFSQTIKIIDNPIIHANGDSLGAPLGGGQAVIQWRRIANVTDGRYTIRPRKLLPSDHYRIGWRILSYDNCVDSYCADFLDARVIDPNPTGLVGDRLSATIDNLQLGELYGVQINYETASGPVFSARDVYVWPSTGFPGKGNRPDRVATFPYFGHWEDRTYRYILCEETFPALKQSRWEAVINKAFEQWESATDGMVIIEHDATGECSSLNSFETLLITGQLLDVNYPSPGIFALIDRPILDNPDVMEDDQKSEIRMFDDTGIGGLITSFPEMLVDPFKKCLFVAPACVTSISGYSNPDRSARITLTSADVSFKQSAFKATTATDRLDIPATTEFNSCNGDETDYANNFAYRTALHEAGHALGISGYGLLENLPFNPYPSEYHVAHPDIPDSVLNYDPKVDAGHTEPDCSLHPFDVLAIYALYQTVSP